MEKLTTNSKVAPCNAETCACNKKNLYGISDDASSELKERALLLSYISLGYNTAECVLSIVAGMLAGSVALIGFGLDSLMESLSGGVMIWRFRNHRNMTPLDEERAEKRAVKLIGYAFFVFGAYVAYESIEKLISAEAARPSLFGIGIAIMSLIAMPALYYFKRQTGRKLNSKSLIADSKQTLACMMLSVALLVGLGMNMLFGVWWADPAVGLIVAVYLFNEGYSAIKEGELCSC